MSKMPVEPHRQSNGTNKRNLYPNLQMERSANNPPPRRTPVEKFSSEDAYDKDSDLPTHHNRCCKGCTPHHSMPCKILYFLLLLALDVSDLVSDWLLFVDVILAEAGLVYGPPEQATIWALLAFSIIGSFTFVFESANLWYEVFRNNPWLDSDLVSMVTIWIEDLPQIAISLYIAHCREDPISYFQLTKAAVCLLALFIRIILTLVKYCNKAALREAHEKTTESKRHVFYRVMIMLALFINAGCAIAIFLFTQTQQDLNGKIYYQVPTSIFEDKYNDARYFQNVSVFVHHPAFDLNLPNPNNHYMADWVRFLSINNIRDQANLDIGYNYIYEKTTTEMRMALYSKSNAQGKQSSAPWVINECYSIDLTSYQVTPQANATCMNPSFFSQAANNVFITFRFIQPGIFFRKYIFGDIRFNIKMKVNNTCLDYDTFTNRVGQGANISIPAIHYYRINATIPQANQLHLLKDDSGKHRFYKSDGSDLEDITDVWKTGWGNCDMSGSIAPNLDRDIPTECT